MLAKVRQHPRLVDDHVRKLRQPVLGVPDSRGALDPGRPLRIGSPEGHLVDPVRLAQETVGQTESLEHLDRAARNSVRLAHLEWSGPAVDDRGAKVGKPRQLCGEHEAGRAASDDENVDLLREALPMRSGRRVRFLAQRIARPVTVDVELHRLLPGRCRSRRALGGIDIRHG